MTVKRRTFAICRIFPQPTTLLSTDFQVSCLQKGTESLNLDTRLAVFPSCTLYQFLASSGTLAYTSIYSDGIALYCSIFGRHVENYLTLDQCYLYCI